MDHRIADKLSLLVLALLLMMQAGAVAYGARLMRDVVGHARVELEAVARAPHH